MLENSKILIDLNSCSKCGACVDECSYLYIESDKLHITKDADEYCIECGKCVAVCPENAITLKNYENEILRDVPTKDKLPSFDSLGNLFQVRRSRRQFEKTSVPRELIEKILNVAGRYSATPWNQQQVHFTVVQNREVLKKLSDEATNQVKNLVKTFEDPQGRRTLENSFPPELIKTIEEVVPAFKIYLNWINKGREVWRRDSEIIIIHSPKNALLPLESCALAACQIMLAAETLGLGTCSLGYITYFFNNFRSVAKIVKLPLKHIVGYTLAVGFPKAKYLRIPARKPLKVKWF
ncbi:MAG: nitroreductase family protein [Promethearchaeota archaeon]|nr:MAG: nitroreductase family protein [Candidatus Lokiarchaeota archaeon]